MSELSIPKAKRPRMDSDSTDSVVPDADWELYRGFCDYNYQNVMDINIMSGGIFHWYDNMWGKLTYDLWPPRLPNIDDLWPRFLHYENLNTVEMSIEGGPFHRYNMVSNDPSMWERLPDDLWQRFLHYLSKVEVNGMGDTFRWYSNMWKQLPSALWTNFLQYEALNTVEIKLIGGNFCRFEKEQFNNDPSQWKKLPDDLWLRFHHYLNLMEIEDVETIRWETNCMWGNLPDELWLRILGHLDNLVSVSVVGATSRRFNRLTKDTKLWKKIEFDIKNINASLEAVQGVLERATIVKEIKFTNRNWKQVDDAAVASLLVMAKDTLKVLVFGPKVKLQNQEVLKLECLTKLEVLDFSVYTLPIAGVNAISKLKNLRELKIPLERFNRVVPWGQEIDLTPLFTELKNLVVVDLTYMHINDATLSLLARNNPNLEHLNITTCSLRVRAWPSLKDLARHCPKLGYLDLTGHRTMSGNSFNALAQCKNLQHLVLKECVDLSDGTLQKIARNCPKLRHVNLTDCRGVKYGGVKALAKKCPNLQFLNLDECKLSSKIVERLKKKYPDIVILSSSFFHSYSDL